MITFRSLGDIRGICLRSGRIFTLILISKYVNVFGSTVSDKDKIVKEYKDRGGLLLLAWTGKYKTEVFRLGWEDLERSYDKFQSL